MELLFEGKKKLNLEVADAGDVTMEWLIDHLKRNYLRDKEEMFV